MSVLQDNLKKVDTTPFFAAVGATDLAVEKVRDARVRAEAARVRAEKVAVDFDPATITTQVKELPALALNQTLVVGGKVVESYESLATRGKGLVTRLRTQQSTKDLVAQAETTVAQAKGAVTTARKAAADIERSAKSTVTTGRTRGRPRRRDRRRHRRRDHRGRGHRGRDLREEHPHRRQAHHHDGEEGRQEDHRLGQGRHDERPQDRGRRREGHREGRRQGRRLTSPPRSGPPDRPGPGFPSR